MRARARARAACRRWMRAPSRRRSPAVAHPLPPPASPILRARARARIGMGCHGQGVGGHEAHRLHVGMRHSGMLSRRSFRVVHVYIDINVCVCARARVCVRIDVWIRIYICIHKCVARCTAHATQCATRHVARQRVALGDGRCSRRWCTAAASAPPRRARPPSREAPRRHGAPRSPPTAAPAHASRCACVCGGGACHAATITYASATCCVACCMPASRALSDRNSRCVATGRLGDAEPDGGKPGGLIS